MEEAIQLISVIWQQGMVPTIAVAALLRNADRWMSKQGANKIMETITTKVSQPLTEKTYEAFSDIVNSYFSCGWVRSVFFGTFFWRLSCRCSSFCSFTFFRSELVSFAS